ncbi:hypothetical protein B0J17DRAFT_720698 [Rhizoctonia solani]|nr:hypothetical protein B0J17DRAFT_720698 [Rhizoctonia solani]
MQQVGKIRFATAKISAKAILICPPALYAMSEKGYFEYGAPKELQRVTKESSGYAIRFKLGLQKLICIADPLARALTCLESTHGTIADAQLL